VDIDGVGVTAHQAHLSLVDSYLVADALAAYERLGYNYIRATASADGESASVTGSCGLYGIGMRYSISKQFSARTEVEKPCSGATTSALA
jgi:hypothetical protein